MMTQQAAQPVGNGMAPPFEVFQYEAVAAPAALSWEAFESVSGAHPMVQSSDREALDCVHRDADGSTDAARELMHGEEVRRSFEAGRERGFNEGRAAEREALSSVLNTKEAGLAEQIAHLVEDFHGERARYFEEVEHDVVKLAMAVAARILRREAQTDPLLLSGAIRVALGQLSASTQVKLQVPPADLELWADAIAHIPHLAPRPAVVAGRDMKLGECVLETELGSVDLGVAAQLAEIERGFFDRASGNPPVSGVREDMSE
jgi:flagellar biosynthesis/type III secretory pathway protein FliH